MLTTEQILTALIRGCNATSAEYVIVQCAQVYQVLGTDIVEHNNLFRWAVETEETQQLKHRPDSVIPQSIYTHTNGYGEVDRALLLELLCEHKNKFYQQLAIHDERGKVIQQVAPRKTGGAGL